MNSIRLVFVLTSSLHCVLCNFQTSSESFDKYEKLCPKDFNRNFISAVTDVLRKSLNFRINTINIVDTAESRDRYRIRDLMSAIIIENRGKLALRLHNHKAILHIENRLKIFNLFLLDKIETFRKLSLNIVPRYFKFSGFYLFVLINGKTPEHDEIFKTMWKLNIFNVNLVYQDFDTVSIATFMPFAPGTSCSNTSPVIFNQFSNGSFKCNNCLMFPEKFKNLQNCPIKIITFDDNLSVFKHETLNGAYELQGYEMQMLHVLSTSLNFKKQITFLEIPVAWGFILQNGTATGALAELQKKEQEIGIGNYFLKPNRLNVLDSSVTYYSFPLVFIIPPAARLSTLKKLLQPFGETVWILMLLTYLTGLLVICFINIRLRRVKSFVYGTGVKHPMTNMLKIILGSSQPKLPKRNFSRFLFMMFSIFCLVQRGIYQGSLYIFLQTDGLEKEMHTLDEMIDNNYEFYMYQSHSDIFENLPRIQKQ